MQNFADMSNKDLFRLCEAISPYPCLISLCSCFSAGFYGMAFFAQNASMDKLIYLLSFTMLSIVSTYLNAKVDYVMITNGEFNRYKEYEGILTASVKRGLLMAGIGAGACMAYNR